MKWTFSELSEDEWSKFLEAHPRAHVFQSVERIKLRQQMGYQNYIVGVHEGKKLVAGGVLLGRRGEFWMAYGPLIDWNDQKLAQFFLSEIASFARSKKLLKIEIFPDILLSIRNNKGEVLERFNQDKIKRTFSDIGFRYEGETVDYEMKAGRWAFVKDLTGIKDAETLRKTYRKTLRARLRQTDGDVKITILKRSELGVLTGLIDESDARHGARGREAEYYEQMHDALGQHVEFLVARRASDNTPIAGAIFLYNKQEIASYLSGMDRRYRDLNGRAWLQDHVMQEGLKKGTSRISFFWVEGKFKNNSLLEFKSGFGGVVEEYIGGFEKVLRPGRYRAQRLARKGKNLARRLLKH